MSGAVSDNYIMQSGTDPLRIKTNFKCLYTIMNPTAVFQADRLLTMHTLFDWILLHVTVHKHCCSHHYDTTYITRVTVSYFNVFWPTWCIILSDDGNLITKTYRGHWNCTVVHMLGADDGFVNNTHCHYIELTMLRFQCNDNYSMNRKMWGEKNISSTT